MMSAVFCKLPCKRTLQGDWYIKQHQHVDSHAEFFQKIKKNAIAIKSAAEKSKFRTSQEHDE